MVMILAALLLMVLVRRFGLVLLELESGKVSQGAMLKQVLTFQTKHPNDSHPVACSVN